MEREYELKVLHEAVQTGGGALEKTFLVSGPAGIGKTALLHAIAQGTREALVLFAAGSRAERDIGLGVLRQLMAHTALPPAAVQLVDRLAQSDAPGLVRARHGSIVHRSDARLLDELCRLLTRESERRPILVVVDDAHEADQPSRAALTYLQRRFRLGGVVFVFAQPLPTAACVDFDGQLTGKRLILAPLSPAAVYVLAAAALGEEWAASHAAEVAEITAGNPGLVTAVIDDQVVMRRPQKQADRVTLGEMFAQAYLTYAHRLDAQTAAVVHRLVLLKEQLTSAKSTTALLACGMPSLTDQIACALDELERAGLLRDGRFRHPDARSALERSLRKRTAEAHDPRIATLHQLAQAGTGRFDWDAEQRDWTRPAADSAHAKAAAVEQLPDRERRPGAGDLSALDVRAVRDGQHRTASAALSPAASLDTTWEAEDDETIPGLPPAEWSYTDMARVWAADPPPLGPGPEPVPADEVSWHRVEEPLRDVSNGVSEGGDPPVAREAAPPSWSLSGTCALPSAREPFATFDTLARQYTDEQAARERLTAEETASRQRLSDQAARLVQQAEEARRCGELRTAADLVDQALRLRPAAQWGPALAAPLAVGVAASTAMGELDRAAELLRASTEEALRESHFGLRLLWSVGQYQIACGRPGEALDLLVRCGQLMARRGVDWPALACWRTSAAQAQIMLGDQRAARALATTELDRAGRDAPEVRGRALRVLAATSTPENRIPLLRESIQLLSGSGERVEVAYSLRDLSLALIATRATGAARSAATRALALARACGVRPLVRDPLLTELGAAAAGTQPPRTDMLSEAERKVADLVVRGHTNRQISKKLFITVSTVEQHLTRTYRKLNVTGRAALIPLLRAEQDWLTDTGQYQAG